jgi:3-keto-disaccharide hydrolase
MKRSAWLVIVAVLAAGGALLAWRGPAQAPPAQAAGGATAKGATKQALFNGKDLAGWVQFLPDHADPARTWSVKDGVIRCTGEPAGYLRTEKSFKNYFLAVEWRWPAKPGNSGVLIHMQRDDHVWPYSIEAQLEDRNAGDFWFIDGSTLKVDEARRNPGNQRNVKHLVCAEKPAGEWNRYEITSIDGDVILVVNGELVNYGRGAVPSEGHVLLQSEGAPIEFRLVEITPFE